MRLQEGEETHRDGLVDDMEERLADDLGGDADAWKPEAGQSGEERGVGRKTKEGRKGMERGGKRGESCSSYFRSPVPTR